LNVKSDQATATFVSANAEVREAIESALPRLREMLAGAGVELGQTNVSAESFRQPGDNGNGSNNRGNAGGNGTDNSAGDGTAIHGESTMIGGSTTIKRGNGLVDTFA
jgi:flagellar hook-length control protein FliK